MPRSGEDARRQLQKAAVELFEERGYEATTAAGIATRAGVTERTFFRHFKDKREVLFDGEEAFRAALVEGVAAAPLGTDPLAAVLCGYRAVEGWIEGNRMNSERRERVIASAPALQERMRTKSAGLVDALAAALERRGVEAGEAMLAAQVGSAIFSHAMRTWLENPETSLGRHMERAAKTLRGLSLGAR